MRGQWLGGECSALQVGDLRVLEHKSDVFATRGAEPTETAMGTREVVGYHGALTRSGFIWQRGT